MIALLALPFLLLLNALVACAAGSQDYHERLLLRPLPQGALLASFHFRSNESAHAFEQQDFRYFPRSLAQILQHANTKELHLRFSLGRWDAARWGQMPWNGAREGGTGVELWAWVQAASDEEASSRWLTLTNALSGLFCASLNFIDATKTTRPVMSFQPEGDHASSSDLHLLHGTLPHEVVCTENLTPFLKLLPCKGKGGISSLLSGHKLFDASWQTMSIDVRPICPENGECVLEMEQTVDMVLNIERSKRPQDNPIPRPLPIEEIACDASKPYNAGDTCFPLDRSAEPSWSLAEIFGRPLQGACPLTNGNDPESSTVCINVPPEREVSVTTAGQYAESEPNPASALRCYQPPVGEPFDLVLPEQKMKTGLVLPSPPLFAARSINGYGQERGSIQAVIRNPSVTDAVEFVYQESLPWFMKPYLHTLRAHLDTSTENPIKETYYRPAVDRQRGTHLELRMVIPAASTLTLTYDFDKAILRYTEYPPDANRGFDAAPAVIRLLSPQSLDRKGIYVRTTSLLLPLPTPDFSMPYNVIILTSTVMALAFGNIFNLLVRRFVGADEVPAQGGLQSVIRGKIARFKALFSRA